MKKKKYIYFIVPLAALVVFVAYYWNFSKGYDQAQDEKAAAVVRAKEGEIKEQNRLREKAVQDALAAADRRKKEKEAKDAVERKKREDRQTAYQDRDKAESDLIKFKEKQDRLAKEVQMVKDEIKKIQQDEDVLREEDTFLQGFVKKAETNAKNLAQVLDKISAADAANAAAARAAAAAAKKS